MKTITRKAEEQIQTGKLAAKIASISDADTFADVLPFIYRMRQYERQLQKLAEHSCNGYPMPKIEYRDGKMYSYNVENLQWKARCEKREAKIEKAVIEYATQFRITVDFQGDPRGMMFSLKTARGETLSI